MVFASDPPASHAWLDQACHRLKHEAHYAAQLLGDLQGFRDRRPKRPAREVLETTITYVQNHAHQMT